MRLVKLHDPSTRPISSTDLLIKYNFGNGYPKEFIPGNTYNEGEYVYIRNSDDSINLFYCSVTGSYDKITSDAWITADIASIAEKIISDKFNSATETNDEKIESNQTSNNIYEMYYYTNDDVIVGEDMILLDFTLSEADRLEIYNNGKYILHKDMLIEPVRKGVTGVSLPEEIGNILVIYYKKSHVNANLVQYAEMSPSTINLNGITFGDTTSDDGIFFKFNPEIFKHDYIVDLYFKGRYVNNLHFSYNVSDDTLQISLKSPRNSIISLDDINKLDDFTAIVTYSRSSQLSLNKTEIFNYVDEHKDMYKLDMRTQQFKLTNEQSKLFVGNNIVPFDKFEINDTILSITDDVYYAELNDYMTLVSKSFVVKGSYDYSGNIIRDTLETYTVTEDSNKVIIPFVNWDSDKDDVLVFKEGGILIDPSRYYIKNGYIVPYVHEDFLKAGNVLHFHLVNGDYGCFIYPVQVTITDYNSTKVRIPYAHYNSTISMLIFKSTGSYISRDNYTIDDTFNVIFSENIVLSPNDTITFIFLDYKSQRTHMINKQFSVKLTTNNEFELPFKSYEPSIHKLMMFSSNGEYLNEATYDIVNNGTVCTKDILLEAGTFVDITVSKITIQPIATSDLSRLLTIF